MTVVLNEAALVALLETEEGPTGRHVARIAEQVVADAAINANAYFGNVVDVGRDVSFDMVGSTATIGITDPGVSRSARRSKARRLAQYQSSGNQKGEKVNWLLDALRTGFSRLLGGG